MSFEPIRYTTLDGLVTRFGEDEVLVLADKERLDSITAPTVIARYEASARAAEALIHSFIGRRYKCPITTVDPLPPTLVMLAEDITMWMMVRGESEQDDNYRMRFKDAKETMNKIASGKVSLGIEDPDVGGGNYVTTTGVPTAERSVSTKNLDFIY